MTAEEAHVRRGVWTAVGIKHATVVIGLKQEHHFPGPLQNVKAAPCPRLWRRAAYGQLEMRERLGRATHVLGVIQAQGEAFRRVWKDPVRRIDDPLWRPPVPPGFPPPTPPSPP